MNSRHPADEICQSADTDPHTGSDTAKDLFAPGFPNAVICYVCICVFFPAPIALLFAVQFADHSEERLFAHYYYIRTTIALMVIGSSIGGVMIVLGAEISTHLILAGLLLAALAEMLAIARCLKGVAFALMRKSPPSYHSYIL
ncbi:hypothetical protein [Roseibium sp.]|uniref:hypothetical protein n=1 Tax=Roseibium sp. TaxID=1936156 RepID=UPI003B509C52